MFELSEIDILQISERGISVETIHEQIEILKRGLPYINLIRPCSINDGIISIPASEFEHLNKSWKKAADSGRLMKFIPASGAASRMFKPLITILNSGNDISWNDLVSAAENGDDTACFALEFFGNIEHFAFYDNLLVVLTQKGIELPSEKSNSLIIPTLEVLLTSKGLNLTNLPKGLIPFHRHHNTSRTPFEEHIVAAQEITEDLTGTTHIHFTLPQMSFAQISNHIDDFINTYSDNKDKFDISSSFQKPSTDTIALDKSTDLLKDIDGQIIFRPGGHGALIENLNELNGDIVSIKNIDNILPEIFHEKVLFFEKLLCGYYLMLEEKLHFFLTALDEPSDNNFLDKALDFIKKDLMLNIPENLNELNPNQKSSRIFKFLNRPLRICGVVKNTGAPGGGPFWISDKQGESKQIVESAQIDIKSEIQRSIWKSSTHFNPVDMVCGLRDFRGEKFNLLDYVDMETSFVTSKNYRGQEIKALELPGLWNGAMSGWLTVFVDVPLFTFNPVKTVNDLLKNNHLTSIE